MERTAPKIFLCHSSTDKQIVRNIAADLVRNGAQVWLDEWELRVGDSISARIQSGIIESSYLAVCLSQSSVSSPWVSKELNAGLAIELDRGGEVFVLPVILEECDIPLFLRDKVYADFSRSYTDGINRLVESLKSYSIENCSDDLQLIINASKLVKEIQDIEIFFEIERIAPKSFTLFRKTENFRILFDKVIRNECAREDFWLHNIYYIERLQQLNEKFSLGYSKILSDFKKRELERDEDIWDFISDGD